MVKNRSGAGVKLPYHEAVARSYEALDLPYGAPLDQVTSRWQEYLKKCHPDHHLDHPDRLSAAFKLTGILTWAHGEILEAWQLHEAEHRAGSFRFPYSADLADCYATLDLPYGAPLDQVTKRWREYLMKCHPDRHAMDPTLVPDANKLTRILTEAYERIKAAWRLHEG